MTTAAAPATKTVTLTINDKSVTVPEKTTLWEAARQAGIAIPALCHKEDLNPVAVCRVCVVDVLDGGNGRGERLLPASCTRECADKMVINTRSERAEAARTTLIELLLAEHPRPCKRHQETQDCELEVLAEKYRIQQSIYTPRSYSKGSDKSNFSIAIDHSACILCDRCVRACTDVAENDVIGRMGKGSLTSISFDNNKPMGQSTCVNCGWCMISCPTGAITYSGGVPTNLAKETGGVVVPAANLKNHPSRLFKKVAIEFLRRSEGGVVERRFKAGEIICRQGEFGSTAYFIEEGEVDIYLETAMSHVKTSTDGGLFNRVKSLLLPRESDNRQQEGDKRYIPIDASTDLAYGNPIARIGAGELIGEASCMNNQPRSATIRAAKDTVVLEMLRNVLDVLRRQKVFKAEMERKYRERALDNHLRSNEVFRDVPPEFVDYLRERAELVSYNPGEVIFRQGDDPDAFYLVRMGHVKVAETYADGRTLVLSYLSRSAVFGEIGLLGNVPRTATCSALDHVELVRIARPVFDEMVTRFPTIRERLQGVANQRIESNRARASTMNRVSLQQYIDQGLYQAQSLLILDLEKCTRCDECVRACAQAHNGVSRLLREGLRYDKYLVTTSCRSCRDPLCMVGCPVGSIRRKNDLEIIIEDHCVGCGRCAEQCPYGNINMHPFEMTLTDLSTGKKARETRMKATVCDLCTDQCLGENDEPSCVYACPHDAAHRVDGQSFFDVQLFGGKAAGEIKLVIIDRQARGWIIVCLLIFAVATAVYIPYARGRVAAPSGGSALGLTYGGVGSGMILIAMLLSARKRVRTMRIGRAFAWMQAHVWFGLLSYPIILYHAGFHFGGPLTRLLMWLFTIVIISGIIGLIFQQFIPTVILKRVPMESIYEQHDRVLLELRNEAEAIVRGATETAATTAFMVENIPAGSAATATATIATDVVAAGARLREFLDRHVLPYLQDNPARDLPLARDLAAENMFEELRQMLPDSMSPVVADLHSIVQERRQIARQRRLHHWLHVWLFVHVPLSWAMLLLASAHAVFALRYR